MELYLQRTKSGMYSTVSPLIVDGEYFCDVLEDVVREEKIAGRTAIPEGKYQVIVTYSPRFKRPLPLLLDVPNYEGVRIHTGNTADDTEGCLIVGKSGFDGTLLGGSSRPAMARLMAKLETLKEPDEKCWITIKNA